MVLKVEEDGSGRVAFDGFNRTFLVLKQEWRITQFVRDLSFNRTFLVLKPGGRFVEVPGRPQCFNRTFLVLKFYRFTQATLKLFASFDLQLREEAL